MVRVWSCGSCVRTQSEHHVPRMPRDSAELDVSKPPRRVKSAKSCNSVHPADSSVTHTIFVYELPWSRRGVISAVGLRACCTISSSLHFFFSIDFFFFCEPLTWVSFIYFRGIFAEQWCQRRRFHYFSMILLFYCGDIWMPLQSPIESFYAFAVRFLAWSFWFFGFP